MQRLNRDSIVAIILLMACGVFIWASFDIRQPNYGVLMPSTWPRIVLAALAFLSLLYLVDSLRNGPALSAEESEDAGPGQEPGISGFFAYWRNPIICFVMFFIFLASLPVLGMLIGGISFVFMLLNLLGGWAPRQILFHAVVAVCAIGAMWSLFTFGLGVMLPEGVIYNPYAV